MIVQFLLALMFRFDVNDYRARLRGWLAALLAYAADLSPRVERLRALTARTDG